MENLRCFLSLTIPPPPPCSVSDLFQPQALTPEQMLSSASGQGNNTRQSHSHLQGPLKSAVIPFSCTCFGSSAFLSGKWDGKEESERPNREFMAGQPRAGAVVWIQEQGSVHHTDGPRSLSLMLQWGTLEAGWMLLIWDLGSSICEMDTFGPDYL